MSRRLPPGMARRLARMLANAYALLSPRRRAVVVENLRPALGHESGSANKVAVQLFRQFGVKLVDLWRYESGLPIRHLFQDLTGWDHLTSAQAQQRGVLLLTVHLGNWEFGAPLLTERGIPLHVISQAEPQPALADLRHAARVRWGIKTLTLGTDPFAAVEIIRRLEENGCVALLMDRPPAATATAVRLFGRPFLASVSAAELARATGCALLPVYIPRQGQGYVAHILPPIPYDRSALREAGARLALTQRIMDTFEDAIGRWLSQWYHFVPIWPSAGES